MISMDFVDFKVRDHFQDTKRKSSAQKCSTLAGKRCCSILATI